MAWKKGEKTSAPMDLGNMRKNGCRTIRLECDCGRVASVVVDQLPDDVFVPRVKEHCRCSACGARPRRSTPDWSGVRTPGQGVS